MYRLVYRVGLCLGAAILALFIGARVINISDPYRILTEDLIAQVAVEPQRTVRLNEYGALALEMRQVLYTEKATAFADWLDRTNAATLVDVAPTGRKVEQIVHGVDTAVHKIAAFDNDLATIAGADALAQDLARLRFYDLAQGDSVLANLYQQSRAVSHSLADVSEGMGEVATAVSAVTQLPALETIQQEVGEWRDFFTSVAAGGLFSGSGAEMIDNAASLADFVYWSIESWQGAPANMMATKQRLDVDVAWLNNFEQQYAQAKAVNDRWHFETLRLLPSFVAENYQPLLLGVIGSLLLALAGWIGSREQQPGLRPEPVREAQPSPPRRPVLAFYWADGRTDHQLLPRVGELTIGNIVIRRARVRYYLERIDNAFPVFLNGQAIGKARTLNDGDVLQIDELQAVFQLVG